MSLYLTKILPVFIYPLGAAILVGWVSLALSFTRYRRIGQALLACSLITLWIAATPIFASWLGSRTQWQGPSVALEALPKSDAIILLGGTPIVRILYALRLYYAGKAPFIVITGGNPPGSAARLSEAERVADFLVGIGAPRSALILETKSRNTRENAINTAELFKERGWTQGLLVTEGSHMSRALASFLEVGLDVTPAPSDIPVGSAKSEGILDLLPDVGALFRTTFAVKEIVGLWVYRLLGWAKAP